MAWAIGDAGTREAIEEALMAAAKSMIADLETQLPLARRGLGGTKKLNAKLAVSMFLHTTSRENDPQLHVHCVIANVCRGSDGRWSAVNSKLLHEWTPALGRVFRCHLTRELQQRLGFELTRPVDEDGKQKSWFEIKGIPQTLIDQFSKRRKQILESVGKGCEKDTAARQRANLRTRSHKQRIGLDQLRKEWKAEGRRHEFDEKAVNNLRDRYTPEPVTDEEYAQVFSDAVRELGRNAAHFRECDVVSAVCEALQHRGVDGGEIMRRIREDCRRSPELVRLTDDVAQSRFSSRENYRIEQKLLNDAARLRERSGATLPSDRVASVLQDFPELDEEQTAAARQLMTQQSSLRILSGVAGSGKSTTLAAVRAGLEQAGHRVLGGALAGKATSELREKTGAESRTVASYLHHLERSRGERLRDRVRHDVRMLVRAARKQRTWRYQPFELPKDTVLMIDESGMLDSRTLSRLLHHARKANATVILAGDTAQLPPILAGGPSDHLANSGSPSTLTTNRRQQDAGDRSAVASLRNGDIAAALKSYADRGRLTVSENSDKTISALVKRWAASGGKRKPDKHLILTQTRRDAHEVNRRCQRERLKRAKLVPGLSLRHGESRFHIRDRIAFHQPLRKYGIENGHSGTVIAVDPICRHLTVKLDHDPANKRRNAFGTHRIVRISMRNLDRDAVTLGYATTTHKAQGMTTENAYVLLTGRMTSRELAYTQLTRARNRTEIFVDESQAGDELETLVRSVSKSSAKNLAHDVKTSKTNPTRQPSREQETRSRRREQAQRTHQLTHELDLNEAR